MGRPTPPASVQVRPGEKLPVESAQAAQAWFLYRDDGPDRNLRKTAQDVHKSLTTIGQWSKRHRWPERALAWDGYQDGLHTAAVNAALEKVSRDWAIEREKQRERELEIGLSLIAKGKMMAEWPLVERRIVDPDGRTTIIMPTKWRMSDGPKYVETGSKMVRLATGMETDRLALDIRQEAERLAVEVGCTPEELLADAVALKGRRN